MLFRHEYSFLSNFYPVKLYVGGMYFPSAENLYQASKCALGEDRIRFTNITASQAKRLGRKIQILPNWDECKVDYMHQILRLKFDPRKQPELAARLEQTGDEKLVEENYWNDTFWGVDIETGLGQNHLGELLMQVRMERRTEMIDKQQLEEQLEGAIEALNVIRGYTNMGDDGFMDPDLSEAELVQEINNINEELETI